LEDLYESSNSLYSLSSSKQNSSNVPQNFPIYIYIYKTSQENDLLHTLPVSFPHYLLNKTN